MTDVVTIENEHWRVGIVPENGGCVAFGQARVAGAWVDVLRPTPEGRLGERWETASFPLVPWSNRVRHGTLLWNGEAYQLRRWGTEDFAMHGTAVEFPWQVIERSPVSVTIEFDAREYYGANFPWDFVARVEFALEGPRFAWRLSIENVDTEAFPAGLGHHPYFVRGLTAGDGASLGDEAQLQMNTELAYGLTDGMADAAAGAIPEVADFRVLRPLGTEYVDTCQTARSGPIAATIDYPGALTIDFEADELLSHLVTYLPVGEQYFAVEPVTNANDGFTLRHHGIDGHGVFVVEPGATTATEFSLVQR